MSIHRTTLMAFVGYLVFVIYGSLIPFELRELSFDQALQSFANIRYLDLGIGSRADWVANIVLYIPLSFLGCAVLMGMREVSVVRHTLLFVVLVFGVFIAVSVEFTQLFFAPRTVSINDLIAETLGTLAGIGLWLFGRRQLCQLWDSFHEGGQQSILAVLYAYFIVYVLQSLFPFDFAVSLDELSWKAAGDKYGWLLAGSCPSGLRCAARLMGEGLAFAPLGLLISLAFSNISPKRTFVAGLLIGLIIEFMQFFIASGVSQGLSVLVRGFALMLGLLAGSYLKEAGLKQVARILNRAIPFFLLPYLVLVTFLADWFAGKWSFGQDFGELLNSVKLMPFYYHYYTTESAAMTSLLANTAMYAPLGLAFWVRRFNYGEKQENLVIPAALAAGLALIVELGKLWVPGKHPDFTNLLIAAVAAVSVYLFIRWVEAALGGRQVSVMVATPELTTDVAEVEEVKAAAPMVKEKLSITPVGFIYALPFAACLLFGLFNYPVAPLFLAVALSIYAFFLWRNSLLWLFVLPFLLVVLDLSERTGRLAIDEFDLFILVTLLVGYLRKDATGSSAKMGRLFLAAITLLWLSWLLSMSIAIWPWLGSDVVLLASSHSPLEAWLVGKGLLWALLLLPLMRAISVERLPQVGPYLLNSLALGLLFLSLAVIWERFIFVGLWDFDNIFRVTGTFASMRTGGAYIEAFIAFSFPALLVRFLVERNLGLKLLFMAILFMAIYAMLVTYSRVGYVALIVGSLAVLSGWLGWRAVNKAKSLALFVGGAGVILVVIASVVSGGFAQERMVRSSDDFSFRVGHWERAIDLMGDGLLTALSGMGFGQYPLNYLMFSDPSQRPTRYEVVDDNGRQPAYLSLKSGKTAYFEQLVSISPNENYQLTMQVRQKRGGALKVLLCEKALLYSFGCVGGEVELSKAEAGWQSIELNINSGALGAADGRFGRPVKFSLYNSAGMVDVRAVSLKTNAGEELIRNGDFNSGSHHWLFATDQDLAWHIHEQWVELYFAQGLLGVIALGLFLLAAGSNLFAAIRKGDVYALALAAGLLAVLTVGLLGSTIDSARISLLIYLAGFCGGTLFKQNNYRAEVVTSDDSN